MARHELDLSFSSSDSDEKEFKSKANKYVCALLNSDGGTLTLHTEMKADTIIRSIEQCFQNVIGTSGVNRRLKTSCETSNKIILEVKGCEPLCTMNYNLYIPTDRQVMLVRPSEGITVKDILNIHRIIDVTNTDKNIPTTFIQNSFIGVKESKTVQFKYLKSGKSGGADLATRLLNNKLTHYVSAFANHCGGRLYCGVRDDGTVEGQQVMNGEKEDLVTQISEYINKMKWPEYCVEPQRGKDGQWDITFEPVTDKDGKPIPSTFVIVIYVAACQGGVFCSEPESYHIIDGEVKKLTFPEWKKRLLNSAEQKSVIASKVPRCDWSSEELRLTCDSKDGELLRMINNGERDELENEFALLQNGTAMENEKRLVILSKLYVDHYRKSQHEEAESCLAEFDRHLQNEKVKDIMIFEVRRHLIHSASERSRGNYRKGYEIAKELLSKVEQLSPNILTVEFYVHFATMFTIIESNKELNDLFRKDLKGSSFKEEALKFYATAIDHLEKTDYVPDSKVDMGQKTYINQAILYLGCSLSGDVVDNLVSKEDIEAASTSLKRANELEIDYGSPMNGFRSCHHSFAKCCLSYRRSQVEPLKNKRIIFLKNAIREAGEAEERAKRYNFDELSTYAKNHTRVFQNELDELKKDWKNESMFSVEKIHDINT